MVDCSELAKTITQLAMNIASQDGVENLDQVVAEMQIEFPTIARNDIVNAIVEVTTGEARKVDELVAKLNAIKQEARQDKKLQEKIESLTNYLETGEAPAEVKKAKKEIPTAIAQLQSIRDDLKKRIGQSEPALAKRLQKQIDMLQKKLETGDYLPKAAPDKIKTPELERMAYQRDKLKREIRSKIQSLKPRTVWEHIAEPFNAARAIMTSFDFSAVLRQGGFIVIGHPLRGLRAVPAMLKSFASDRIAMQINAEILDRPNAPLYARSNLYIAPLGSASKLSKMEEAYMSNWAERIPFIRRSERAYIIFLNKLRADSFDTMAATLGKFGEVNQKEAEAIANYINVATGRGNLGRMDQAAIVLNTVFFSPRNVASRFQLLIGQPFYKGSWRTRTLIASEYARYLIGMGLIYALADMAGFDLEWDPRSSDFGKIRIGNTRIDPLSGLAQVTVLLSRLWAGETKKTTTGKIVPIRGEDVPYKGDTSWSIMAKFARTKLSPMFGTAVDLLEGKDVVGEKVTFPSAALKLAIPLSLQDIAKSIEEQGVPTGTAISLTALLGWSVQTYEDRNYKNPPRRR